MKKRRESMILSWAERIAGWIRDLLSKSFLIQGCASLYPKLEHSFYNGRLCGISNWEAGSRDWRFRFRRCWMYGNENSLFLGFFRRFGQYILQTDIASLGCFGILYGALSASIALLEEPSSFFLLSLAVSLCVTVLSIPLLSMKRSFGNVIKNSFFLGWFLFYFCGLSEERLNGIDRGKERPWQALFWALLLSVFSPVLKSYVLFGVLAVGLLVMLAFSVPELVALLILLFFPFLHLLPHPTVILAAAVLLTDLAWLWKAFCGRRLFRFGILDYTVLLLMLLFLLGGLTPFAGSEAAMSAVILAILSSFWFPTVNLFSQSVWKKRAYGALKLSGTLCALMGIAQYAFGRAELRWIDTARFSDIGGRVCGPFQNPNVFAVYLLLIAPLLLIGSLENGLTSIRSIFTGCAFLTVLLCIILTWSRGAWLGIIAAMILVFIAWSRRSFGCLLFSMLPILFLSRFLPHNIANRFSSISSLTESSIRYRLYTWQGIKRLILEHPWGIGVGAQAFECVYPRYAVSGTETVSHAHQFFLQILSELGLIGGVTFFFFFLLLFFLTATGLRDLHGISRSRQIGAAAAVLAVLVMGLFDHLWYQKGMVCLLFSICAFLSLENGGKEYER